LADEPLRSPVNSDLDRPNNDARNGVLAALFAYGAWGGLPLLFRELQSVSALLIVAERTVWSLVLLAVVLIFTQGFGEIRRLFADPKRRALTFVSALLLGANWLTYVWAVESNQVLQASFGYFINPIVNVLIGIFLLGERQNRRQTIAIVIATLAVIIQGIGMGSFPLLAIVLALTFGFYGYFRKTAQLGSITGLFAETLMLGPFALAYIFWGVATTGPGPHADPYLMFLLVLSGPITAIPLMAFGYAVQRLRMTTMGMFQYIAPTLQFLLAIMLFGEALNGVRLVSFVLIWVAVAIFTYDSVVRYRQAKVPSPGRPL
jgi:chloramphenicol-sensitive protein RarD